MKRTIKYIIALAVLVLVVYFSLDIRKLDEYKLSGNVELFDAENYATNVWEDKLPKAIESATELTFLIDQIRQNKEKATVEFGHKLGISKTWYFLVKGEGKVVEIQEEALVLTLENGTNIQLATAFIFGNAVREASGVVNIDDFVNMTDFNNVSVALNKKVKNTIIPPLKENAKVGANIGFAGAVEWNEESSTLSAIRIIPIDVNFNDAN